MSVTMEEVQAALSPDEPNYVRAAELGEGALPYLSTLVREADPLLASKATYLASLIATAEAGRVVSEAAASKYPEVRVAAADGAGGLSEETASNVLVLLVNDADPNVRRIAIQATPDTVTPELRSALEAVAADESTPSDVRDLANRSLRKPTR